MSDILKAFICACRDIWHPRMLTLALWPMLAALALWLGLAYVYWVEWTNWIDTWLAGSLAVDWLPADGWFSVGSLGRFAAWLLITLLLVPLIFATAGMLAALLVMPLIVSFVAARSYPQLERRSGGSFIGSFFNALLAVTIFAVLWLVTLPLWLIGVLGPPLALLLSAWFNQRLFRYDALAEHADAAELGTTIAASRGSLFLLGVLVALLYSVPFVNLFAPVVSGLAFTHFLLARLAALRAAASQA
jgi:CysZ protein